MGWDPNQPADPQQPNGTGAPPPQGPYQPQGPYPSQGPYPPQGPYQPQGPYPSQGPYQPQGPYPPQGPYQPSEDDRDQQAIPPIAWGIMAAVVVIAVAVISGLLLTGGDGEPEVAVEGVATAAGGEEFVLAEGEIFLEPAAEVGPEPFDAQPAAEAPPPELAPTPMTTEGRIEAPANVTLTSDDGATPGLYGGSRNNARCDRPQIEAFLAANPSHAQAWTQALNADPTLRWSGGNTVSPSQIPDYLAELTPVTLRTDTRVTNHGYRNGVPTPRQSVLQAGTAVLVDAYGVPRVRCFCGNPLTQPQAVPVGPIYVGPVWPGFTPVNITVIQQSTTIINVIQIIDIDTNIIFGRPVGTLGTDDVDRSVTPPPDTPTDVPDTPTDAPDTPTDPGPVDVPTLPPDVVLGTGDVQVTLLWSSDSDLDLHVIDPDGTEIYFGNSTSPSGGELDHDDIPGCGETGSHAENVFWPTDGAPGGQYQAFVRHFSSCGGPSDYVLEVRVDGQVVASDSGSLADGADSSVITFQVG